MSCVIRLYSEGDREKLKALQDSIFPLKYDDSIYDLYLDPTHLSLVIEEDSQIIGVSTSSRYWVSSFFARRAAYLDTFGISEKKRHQGLGKLLMDVTCACLWFHYGCERLSLDVQFENKEAFGFYRKRGFDAQGIRENYYEFGGKKHDAVFMEKWLSECYVTDVSERAHLSPEVENMLTTKKKASLFSRFVDSA